MARQVNYEVHVKQKGRWEIHARHPSTDLDAAINEAKTLDVLANIEEVKVIREVYNPETGDSKEYNVYRSPGAAAAEHGGGGGGGDGGGGDWGAPSGGSRGWSAFDDDGPGWDAPPPRSGRGRDRPGRVRKKSTFTAVLVKILLIILVSISIASLVAGGVVVGLRDTSLSSNAQTNIMFAVFVVIFLLCAIVMSMNFLSKEDVSGPKIAPPPRPVPRPAKPEKDKKEKVKKEKEKKEKEKKEKKEKKEIEEEDLVPSEEGLTSDADWLEEAKRVLEENAAASEAEASGKPPVEEPPAPAPEDKSAKQPALSPHAEKQRLELMGFLSGGLENMNTELAKLDSYNKFGINLFLAGACEGMSQKRNLDVRSANQILAETVSLMGFKKGDAAKFADKYEDYLLADSRYMQMFQAGRNAMSTHLDSDPGASRYMAQAMNEWNKPKPREEVTGPVTVLFTDIAGSTAMTQTLGDAVAQQIVRAHNRIVRDALTQHGGKEIKHTGDGIMASFSTTSNGVEGAIAMQRGVALHNQNNPDLPLKIKIGINAGEPISEDNDLFGSTVQMAARIVDKAKADQIFVSEIVRGICAGKPIKFESRGQFDMKGFDDPPTLYEAVWK